LVEQDARTAEQVTKEGATAYLADSSSTVFASPVTHITDLLRVGHNLIHSLLPHVLSKVLSLSHLLLSEL
jgi:hypothetical protein